MKIKATAMKNMMMMGFGKSIIMKLLYKMFDRN